MKKITITNTLLYIFFSSVLFGQSACNSNCFMNKYNFSDICKAEVSDFNKNNYKPINCEKFLEIIYESKYVVSKFVPHKKVVLYDKNGKTYDLYFSGSLKIFQIDGNSFRLSKKQAFLLSELFN